jgi:hypothetical protein
LPHENARSFHKIGLISAVLVLAAFVIFNAGERQKAEWKGSIKEENGVAVVKNPDQPCYLKLKSELFKDEK